LILLLVYLVYRIIEPFLMPLGWAAVFAVIFLFIEQAARTEVGRNLSAALSTAGVTLILIVPALLLMTLFVREGIDATRDLQASMAAGEYGGFNRAWGWDCRTRGGTARRQSAGNSCDRAPAGLADILASELGRCFEYRPISVRIVCDALALSHESRQIDVGLCRHVCGNPAPRAVEPPYSPAAIDACKSRVASIPHARTRSSTGGPAQSESA